MAEKRERLWVDPGLYYQTAGLRGALAEWPGTCEKLADRLDEDVAVVGYWLDALECAGWVERKGRAWRLSVEGEVSTRTSGPPYRAGSDDKRYAAECSYWISECLLVPVGDMLTRFGSGGWVEARRELIRALKGIGWSASRIEFHFGMPRGLATALYGEV